MKKSIGLRQILATKHKNFGVQGEWLEALGDISRPFSWLVYGHPKNGKTTFVLQFCKYISQFTRVYYNSIEQGNSKTYQDAIKVVDMSAVRDGAFMLGDRDSYSDMFEKLKTNRAGVVVIDSRDYIHLTTDQWKKLTNTFKSKSFILICWEQNGKPFGKYAKDIEYMVDMKSHVKGFMAFTDGRFGAKLRYTIWKEAAQNNYGGLFK